jgi:hypothetical protein
VEPRKNSRTRQRSDPKALGKSNKAGSQKLVPEPKKTPLNSLKPDDAKQEFEFFHSF